MAGGYWMTRRQTLVMAGAAIASAAGPVMSQAQMNDSGAGAYFVPGGRIGLRKPPEIDAWSNRWTLLSKDHTLSVAIREALRLGPDHDAFMWDKDARSQRVGTSFALPGYEVRRFRDLRYGSSIDYASDAIVMRDSDWIGEVQASNSDLGSPIKRLGGQNARWQTLREQILSSIVVRPRPPISDALAELRVELDANGINPRMVGETLILSLYAPRGAVEAWGANESTIRIVGLPLTMPGLPDEREKAMNEMFSIARTMPDVKVIKSPHCRGVVSPERRIVDETFGATIEAYGRTRTVKLQAIYKGSDRAPILAAMERVFQSMRLMDSV